MLLTPPYSSGRMQRPRHQFHGVKPASFAAAEAGPNDTRTPFTCAYDFSVPGMAHRDLCNRQDLTLHGAVDMAAVSREGRAYITDTTSNVAGTSTYLDATLPTTAGVTSFPCWLAASFDIVTMPAGTVYMLGLGATVLGAADYFFILQLDASGHVIASMKGTSATNTCTSSTTYAVGETINAIAYQVATNVLVLYINGWQVASSATTIATPATALNLFTIGALQRNSGTPQFLAGANVRWNFAGFGQGIKEGAYPLLNWTMHPWSSFRKAPVPVFPYKRITGIPARRRV